MSRDASVSLVWGDGEHRFRLGLGELRELQEKCDAGPPLILRRLQAQEWRVDDVIETLRLGLIGGGLKPDKAYALVQRYGAGRPLGESVVPAMVVLASAILGVPEEPVGKDEAAEETEAPASRETSSPSPPSTDPEL